MLDLRFICENADLVKENIKRKFKDDKLPLVDEVIALYKEKLATNTRANDLRANRNKVSKQIGVLMAQGKRDEAEDMKKLADTLEKIDAGIVASYMRNATMAKEKLGWTAENGIREMCEDSWRWQKNNPNGYGD